jgi:hypothetical protein
VNCGLLPKHHKVNVILFGLACGCSFTRLWNRWPRLTLDLRRPDLKMNSTTNISERVIGWWIKERYRTMRGYKRTEAIFNVVTLTARLGAQSGTYDLAGGAVCLIIAMGKGPFRPFYPFFTFLEQSRL